MDIKFGAEPMSKVKILHVFILIFNFYCFNIYATDFNAGKEINGIYVAKYIPSSSTASARIMELSFPRKHAEITLKIQKAMRADPNWTSEYIRKNDKPGPLPYNPKLGISKSEYEQFLSSKLGLVEKGKTKLSFIKNKDGSITIMTDKRGLPLNGITILSDNKGVKTPYGVLDRFSTINNKDKNSPTGPWQGMQWKIENIIDANHFPPSISAVKFSIGVLDSKKEGILYYDVKNSPTQEIFHYVIFYDL